MPAFKNSPSAYITQLSSCVHKPSSWQTKDLARSWQQIFDILALDVCKHQLALQVREEPPWQQLATATHVAQQAPQDAAIAKPHLEAWDQALHKNELQLLQLHIAATLHKPCQYCSSVLDTELVLMLCCYTVLRHSATVLEPVNSMLANVYMTMALLLVLQLTDNEFIGITCMQDSFCVVSYLVRAALYCLLTYLISWTS